MIINILLYTKKLAAITSWGCTCIQNKAVQKNEYLH